MYGYVTTHVMCDPHRPHSNLRDVLYMYLLPENSTHVLLLNPYFLSGYNYFHAHFHEPLGGLKEPSSRAKLKKPLKNGTVI
jgi:hypothetical protein